MLHKKFLKFISIITATTFLIVSLYSQAGCGNSEAEAWMVDAATGKNVKNFGKGEVVQ